MSSLSRRHRVVAPDARGHGSSANASRPFRATDDVAALIAHLDAGPAVLVGLSMGGATAVDTALEHPDLVRALVVAGSGSSRPTYQDPWLLEILEDQQRALAAGDIEAWSAAWLRSAAGPHRSMDEIDGQLLVRLREMAQNTTSKHTPGNSSTASRASAPGTCGPNTPAASTARGRAQCSGPAPTSPQAAAAHR